MSTTDEPIDKANDAVGAVMRSCGGEKIVVVSANSFIMGWGVVGEIDKHGYGFYGHTTSRRDRVLFRQWWKAHGSDLYAEWLFKNVPEDELGYYKHKKTGEIVVVCVFDKKRKRGRAAA